MVFGAADYVLSMFCAVAVDLSQLGHEEFQPAAGGAQFPVLPDHDAINGGPHHLARE